jgi:transposase-like protein
VAQRRKHTGQFKARVALEAIAGHKTVNEISAEYGVHASQIHQWKKEALERLPEVLDDGRHNRREGHEAVASRLYQQIGQLTMEVEYLKKKSGLCP